MDYNTDLGLSPTCNIVGRPCEPAYDDVIGFVVRILALRDNETANHSIRVVDHAVAIARRFHFTPEQLVRIRRGALLHDIGKMGVPDSILKKPGALTEEEWAIMRLHPTFAFTVLQESFALASYSDIAHYHHERWNGSGYPRGLAGTAIPIEARIFAVADVWDAMTNDRVYRKAIPRDEVIAYLKSQAGLLFDPAVIDHFTDIVATA